MGGAALGRQAKILTTAHLELLIRHCQTCLAPLFPATRPLLAFQDKETHGDLDLLVAYEVPFDPKKVKGEEFGLLDDEGENLGPAPWHPVQGGTKDKGLGREGPENNEFRDWAVSVVRALKGREWKRSGVRGGLMSVGVPCIQVEGLDHESLGFYVKFNDSDEWSGPEDKVLKEGAARFEKEPFYQVDLQFISPDHLEFTHFFRSYSNILLSHLITLLSIHLRASGTHLSFHYSPYPGLGPIRIELTSDPEDFCRWLGLDYERFLRGFETKKDLWVWVTNVKEGGKADKVWAALVRRYKQRPETGIVIERVSMQWRSRNPGWSYFLEWLRLSGDSPYSTISPRVDDEVKETTTAFPETTVVDNTATVSDARPHVPAEQKPRTISQPIDVEYSARPRVDIPITGPALREHPFKNAQAKRPSLHGRTVAEPAATNVPLPETPAIEIRPPLYLSVSSPRTGQGAARVQHEKSPASHTASSASEEDHAASGPAPSGTQPSFGTLSPEVIKASSATPPQSSFVAQQVSTTSPPTMGEPRVAKDEPLPAAPSKDTPEIKPRSKLLDPADPVALCPIAREALMRWAKMSEFERLMRDSKETAEVRKAAQRANAEERAREKAETEATALEGDGEDGEGGGREAGGGETTTDTVAVAPEIDSNDEGGWHLSGSRADAEGA